MKNKVLFEKKMFKKMMKGVDVVYKTVALTMGAAGKNIAYRSEYSGKTVSTNDGIRAARMVNLSDETESMGADITVQSAERTNEEAGDATSATVVLNRNMIHFGLKKVLDKSLFGFVYKKGVNGMVLKSQMKASVDRLISKLKEISIPIVTDEQLLNVANISMENLELAKIVADSVKKVGENGIVLVEESSKTIIERKDIDGLKFSKGYITPYMVTNPNTMEAVIEDVHVLVTDKNFQMNKDLFPLLEQINTRGIKKLFVVCAGMSGEILASIIKNRMEQKFFCVAVEKPFDENMLEDIAILTGAENVTNSKYPGDSVELKYGWLGKAEKIIVEGKSTLIIGGAGSPEKVNERIEVIKKEIEETDSSYVKENLKERLAKLSGGIVILKVGAPTEGEMKYLKDKFDDAVATTKSALQEGIIPGGGRVLYDFSKEKAIDAGDEIVKKACAMPMTIINRNAGFRKTLKEGEVLNVLTGKITITPIEDGLVDATKAQRCALKNAVDSAGSFLTYGGSFERVLEKKEVLE